MKADKFKFLPEDEALSPTKAGFYQHITNAWWTVHTERGLAFYSPGRKTFESPQCNNTEVIARKVAESISYPWPHEIKFFASVWVPIDPRDWA